MSILMTFVLTTALNVALVVYAFRKVTAYLQRNAEARDKVVEHVLIPIFGQKPDHAKNETQQDRVKNDTDN